MARGNQGQEICLDDKGRELETHRLADPRLGSDEQPRPSAPGLEPCEMCAVDVAEITFWGGLGRYFKLEHAAGGSY